MKTFKNTLFFACILVLSASPAEKRPFNGNQDETPTLERQQTDGPTQSENQTQPIVKIASISPATGEQGKTIEIPLNALNYSITLKNMLEDVAGNPNHEPLPVHNVTGTTLHIIGECLKLIANEHYDVLNNVVTSLSDAQVYELALAANYLDIEKLLIVCQTVIANINSSQNVQEAYYKNNQHHHIVQLNSSLPLDISYACVPYLSFFQKINLWLQDLYLEKKHCKQHHTFQMPLSILHTTLAEDSYEYEQYVVANVDSKKQIITIQDKINNTTQTITNLPNQLQMLCFNSKGTLIAAATNDNSIYIWDIADKQSQPKLITNITPKVKEPIYSLSFNLTNHDIVTFVTTDHSRVKNNQKPFVFIENATYQQYCWHFNDKETISLDKLITTPITLEQAHLLNIIMFYAVNKIILDLTNPECLLRDIYNGLNKDIKILIAKFVLL